jgi:hypothetical protein
VRVEAGRTALAYLIGPRAERTKIKMIRRLPARVTATNGARPAVARNVVLIGKRAKR